MPQVENVAVVRVADPQDFLAKLCHSLLDNAQQSRATDGLTEGDHQNVTALRSGPRHPTFQCIRSRQQRPRRSQHIVDPTDDADQIRLESERFGNLLDEDGSNTPTPNGQVRVLELMIILGQSSGEPIRPTSRLPIRSLVPYTLGERVTDRDVSLPHTVPFDHEFTAHCSQRLATDGRGSSAHQITKSTRAAQSLGSDYGESV